MCPRHVHGLVDIGLAMEVKVGLMVVEAGHMVENVGLAGPINAHGSANIDGQLRCFHGSEWRHPVPARPAFGNLSLLDRNIGCELCGAASDIVRSICNVVELISNPAIREVAEEVPYLAVAAQKSLSI